MQQLIYQDILLGGKKGKRRYDSFFFLGLISTFLIIFNIKVVGIALFKYIAFGFGAYFIIKNGARLKKKAFTQSYSKYFYATTLSVIIILCGDAIYKEYSIRFFIDFAFLMFLCFSIASSKDDNLISFIRGVKISCIIQLIWCFFQAALWYVLHIDLNKKIFVDILHVAESASKMTSDGTALCISGLCHHPSNLIVVIILILALFKKIWKWPVSIAVAVLSRNSTTLIAIAISMLLYILPSIYDFLKYHHFSKKSVIIFFALVGLLISTAVFFRNSIFNRIQDVTRRIKAVYEGGTLDGSTFAHVGYYTFLPEVWKRFNLRDILFGYSYGWTGGMFYVFFQSDYGMYFTHSMINAGVESDPMNYIYGIGIIGTMFFYGWLIKEAIRGHRINRIYTIMFMSIIFSGVFYSIQYSYVILIEVVLSELIRRNISLFQQKKGIT